MARRLLKKNGNSPHRSKRTRIAEDLAHQHFDLDQGVEHIFLLKKARSESGNHEPIKLLEVNRETVECGIMPVYFGPSRGIPYPLVVVDVSPREFSRLRDGRLTLPDGWKIARELTRAEA
jgi:hypothetical protein